MEIIENKHGINAVLLGAIVSEDLSRFEEAIALGADPCYLNDYPIRLASERGVVKLYERLCELGAYAGKDKGELLNSGKSSPSMLDVIYQSCDQKPTHIHIAKMLISAAYENKVAPFLWFFQRKEIFDTFDWEGSSNNWNWSGHEKLIDTICWYAVARDSVGVITWLLKNIPSSASAAGSVFLRYACSKELYEIARLAMEKGADVSACDHEVMRLAGMCSSGTFIDAIIRKGGDIDLAYAIISNDPLAKWSLQHNVKKAYERFHTQGTENVKREDTLRSLGYSERQIALLRLTGDKLVS